MKNKPKQNCFVSLKILSPEKLFDFQSHDLEHTQTISEMWKHLWNLWEKTISQSLAQNKPTRTNNAHIIREILTGAHRSTAHPEHRPQSTWWMTTLINRPAKSDFFRYWNSVFLGKAVREYRTCLRGILDVSSESQSPYLPSSESRLSKAALLLTPQPSPTSRKCQKLHSVRYLP